ncbi:MAG: flagellin, partial [Cyanobacteria bacterium NC_groundwater_1444_Ag_S-0.65um_54_12]|nr:flagellin [Cyanobacteria bacterium NC_groundwater_1444_Ag_S-0.65um_54_12]
ISLMQTAEGALNETEAILQRMREMAVQSANDTLTASDRSYIASELDQLSREIDRIANSTQFNSQLLLAGGSISLPGITLQIGANSGQVMNIQISTASAEALGVLITQISIDSADNASNTISRLDNAVEQVSNTRSWLGAMINRLQHTITNLDVQYENLSAAQSRIRDLDVAAEMAELTRSQILNQSSVAMLAQANQAPQSILSLLK